ncbi:hypothetical protein [Rubrivirga litoralis]|uniref:DUF1707 domain-containing protein n=1 Tax=Rubrivirga litoralis TaxID=3075598 RepID=A0ABU3BUH8_9BACT|nr:hypothetical protein [Rubrivirga sp. F394]MDT0632939.1 hypothetical protein [Rubrivirga sp. F394]
MSSLPPNLSSASQRPAYDRDPEPARGALTPGSAEPPPPADRTYSEAEAVAILRSAARQQGATAAQDSGLTLGEIEEAAHAAGIDPALVRAAAESPSTAPPADGGRGRALPTAIALTVAAVLAVGVGLDSGEFALGLLGFAFFAAIALALVAGPRRAP